MNNLKAVCDGTIVALSHISARHADDSLAALEEMIVVGDVIRNTIIELSGDVQILAEAEEIISGEKT